MEKTDRLTVWSGSAVLSLRPPFLASFWECDFSGSFPFSAIQLALEWTQPSTRSQTWTLFSLVWISRSLLGSGKHYWEFFTEFLKKHTCPEATKCLPICFRLFWGQEYQKQTKSFLPCVLVSILKVVSNLFSYVSTYFNLHHNIKLAIQCQYRARSLTVGNKNSLTPGIWHRCEVSR